MGAIARWRGLLGARIGKVKPWALNGEAKKNGRSWSFVQLFFLSFLMSKENVSDAQGREWCEAVSALSQEILLILRAENDYCLGMVVI